MQNTTGNHKPRILIVDDVEANLISLESLLEEEDCHIVRAGSGKEALARVLETDFALILLDVQMPNMDGYETASLIRGMKKTRYIPIIFITAARKDEPHVFKGYQKGAVDYLYKPLNPIILKSKVRVFLELYNHKELIRDQAEELEKKVEEMTRLKEVADRANQAKSEFLSNMNHEIRTPLNAIFGYAQILKLDESLLSARQKNAVDGIHRAGQHLMRLIDQVLDLAKIEAGHVSLDEQEFDLTEVIHDLRVMFEPVCRASGVQLLFEVFPDDGPCWVVGDDQKLKQVLINLIGNAAKFTEKGSITIRMQALEPPYFKMEIRDTGKGIPKDKQESIFEPFMQTHLGQSKGGTGLGLAISKKFVELMGGDLKLISEENRGSTFYFTIPLKPANGKPQAPGIFEMAKYQLPDNTRVKALIVDDIPDNVEVLSHILRDLGLEIRVAFNGREAVEIAREWKPDIIFMDYQMPELNGLDAAREVRKTVNLERLKIILLSASVLSHIKEDILQQEVHDGYITKPFMQRDIIQALERHLNVKFRRIDGPS